MGIEPGQIFAKHFRIEGLLGEGGVGRVYQVRDLRTQERVALKCLRPEYFDDPRIRRRFMREARAINRLSHENIVRILSYGEDYGQRMPYIAMELLEGPSLSEFREQLLPIPILLKLMGEILAGLAYAHARGIVHRDVKPENIIVLGDLKEGRTAQIKLLDFGFARVEGEQDNQGTRNMAQGFGTPLYMSPEQASPKGEIGPATDIYAVGVILYEFLAGRPPFTGPHGMAVALKHMTEAVPKLNPRPGLKLPQGLEAIVLRALEKAPADRFPSAADMKKALEALSPSQALLGSVSLDRGEFLQVLPQRPQPASLHPVEIRSPSAQHHLFHAKEQPLIGREEEMLWLWTQVRQVCEEGQQRLLLLGAAPGMGQRWLLRWLQEQVNEGGWMFGVGGQNSDSTWNTGLRAAFRELFAPLPPERGEAMAHLLQLLQRWGGPNSLDIESLFAWISGEEGSRVKGRVLYALLCEILSLAARERPVLLILGTQSARLEETRHFLRQLWEQLCQHPFPIMVVVAWSADEHGEPKSVTAKLLQELNGWGPYVEPRLIKPLETEAVARSLMQFSPLDSKLAQMIAERSEGNPLFAQELLKFLSQTQELLNQDGLLKLREGAGAMWPGNLKLTLLLRARNSALSARDGNFVLNCLESLAILGDSFNYPLLFDFLERVMGKRERIEAAIESLLQSQLLIEPRGAHLEQLQFSQSLLATALKEELELKRREALHKIAATLMIKRGDLRVKLIADHFREAKDWRQAIRYYSMAAEQAYREGFWERALNLLGWADELLSTVPNSDRHRAQLWLDMSEIEFSQGDPERARNMAVRVHNWALRSSVEDLRGKSLLLLGDLYQKADSLEEASASFIQARQAFSAAKDQRGSARVLLGQAMVEQRRGRRREARSLYTQAYAGMRALRDALGMARAARALGEIALREEAYTEGIAWLKEAQHRFAKRGDLSDSARCDWLLGETYRLINQQEEAFQHLEIARRDYSTAGDSGGLAWVCLSTGRLCREEGKPKEALPHLRAALSAFQVSKHQKKQNRLRLLEELANTALEAREYVHADTALREALAIALSLRDDLREAVIHAALAQVAAERGDPSTCDAELSAAFTLELELNLIDGTFAQHLEAVAHVDAREARWQRSQELRQRALNIYQSLKMKEDIQRLQKLLQSQGVP